MRLSPREFARNHSLGIRDWLVWENPPRVVVFIHVILVLYLGTVAAAVATTPQVTPRAMAIYGTLVACDLATVELTRKAGENAGLQSDIHAVWEIPVAVLLPPIYALTVPIIRISFAQWRMRRLPVHRRVFTAAVVGLACGAASIVFHSATSDFGVARLGLASIMLVAAAALVQWAVNWVLILPAVKGSDPTIRIRATLLSREIIQNDVTELCVAVLVALGLAVSLVTVVFALPFVTLLQRSLRHAQLLTASRIDLKTGLLNAGTWEREAASEIARAVRTRAPLALALIDIDHFKAINDVHGHLAGDKALKTIARTFKIFVRDYDLVGRFGGEEFALLLPQTAAADAYRIAERIREHIAAMPLDVGEGPDGQPVRVTVSLGVAALGGWERTAGSRVADLLAAADRALYQAKRNGRDQVCMITDLAMMPPPPPAAREDSPLTA